MAVKLTSLDLFIDGFFLNFSIVDEIEATDEDFFVGSLDGRAELLSGTTSAAALLVEG